MIEILKLFGLAEMCQSTRNEVEKQQVGSSGLVHEFLLDIPWTFTYDTRAFARKPMVRAGLV